VEADRVSNCLTKHINGIELYSRPSEHSVNGQAALGIP